MTSSRVSDVLRRQASMENEQRLWLPMWEDVAELIDTRYVNTFRSQGNWNMMQGQDRTLKQFDIAPPLALERFASVMDWMLTPINQKYQRIKSDIPELNAIPRVARYLDAVRDTLFAQRYSPKANFASQIGEHWMGLGAFGTSSTFTDRRDGGGLRYRNLHIAQLFFQENHQGIIDTVHYRFRMTSRQAMQKFSKPPFTCPKIIMDEAADPAKCDTYRTFLHCVYPNSDMDPNRIDYKGMAFTSLYVCVELQEECGESGYATMPYAISRYVTAPGETYGRSPAMKALPNIKSLNQMKRTILKMGERALDPVLLAHDDGVVGSVTMRPGFTNYGAVTADGKKLVHTLDTGSNMPIGQELMQDERDGIKDVFLATVFKILEDNPQMTATQVLEMTKAKNALVAPMMGRQQSECLGPLTERELDLLSRQQMLPPMPPEMKEAGGGIHLVYDSPMSRAMRAEEASGFQRTVELGIEFANATQNPGVLDWANFDVAMPELADINAVPARWVRTPDEINAVKQARGQQQKQQQLLDAAPSIASIVKQTGSNASAQ